MALFPLCRHNRQPRDAVTHAAFTIERTQADPMQRADWLHLLSVFGMMAYPKLNVIELIGREKMKDSILWKEAMAEGEQRGEVRGVERGKLELRRADIVA